MVSIGNMVRGIKKELTSLGIDLAQEFTEAERDMKAGPIDDRLLSEGSHAIAVAAKELGYNFVKMPKAIDPDKCVKCANCASGCRPGAKWTALDYLKEALASGVEIKYGATAKQVIIENGKAVGIRVETSQGTEDFFSETVVLSAGGLETPVILQNSGIEDAGAHLFIDLYIQTYGLADKFNLLHEPKMALVDLDFHETDGFLLSPYTSTNSAQSFIEIGPRGLVMPPSRMIGIMTKIADDSSGRVFPDGKVSKPVTPADWVKLKKGAAIAREILIKAGAAPHSIVDTVPGGAHPGGTAGIGRVVDTDLQTRVDNLFVCDASVLPTAPGLPPILTIVALAKRLAKTLASS